MKIRLLKQGYKTNEQFYHDFLDDKINGNTEYFTDDYVYLDEAPDFPIYMALGSENKKEADFMEAFQVLSKYYITLDKEVWFNGTFWHSLLCTEKREYLLKKYPQIEYSFDDFKNIVTKTFDFKNYIYKCVFGAQCIEDKTSAITDEIERKKEKERYYRLIINNMDFYNYLLNHTIFKNGNFILKMLNIIDEENLSGTIKKKLNRSNDLRIGRLITYEFNKNYPLIAYPLMDKEDLKKEVLHYVDVFSKQV